MRLGSQVTAYRLDISALEAVNISGRLAVWMFFGLSGYVIGYGFFSQRHRFDWLGVIRYLIKRAFRILPLFWLATIVAAVLLWLNSQPSMPTLRQFLAFQLQHIDYPVGVFWTLGVELQFYLIAPLIAAAILAAGRWSLAVGGALWFALWLSFGDTPDDLSMIGNLQHFLVGILIARAHLSGYLDKLMHWWATAGAASEGIVAIGVAKSM